MNKLISAKQLRSSLPDVVKQVRRGTRFTVIYRSRLAFQIVPMDPRLTASGNLRHDTLYRAKPAGRSSDGGTAAHHDAMLYGR
jgi:antitoxin (DNA-binding transcriptional repressor) of toxin-antitoxin stability system